MLREPKENLAFTCRSHGDEMYFKVKEQEKKMPNFVYAIFQADHKEVNTERMWIEIVVGDQKDGWGYLRNDPQFVSDLRNSDRCSFYTTDDGITKAELM